MNQLEKPLYLKIKDIVKKLHVLDCTLLGNKEDAWIMELFFQPGIHRCHLIEWILSRLGYNIGKMAGPQNSAEYRRKSLKSAVEDLGICRENSKDIIEATASIKEQLDFWCTLVNLIWLKNKIHSNMSIEDSTSVEDSGVGSAISPEKAVRNKISEEYHKVCSSLDVFFESGNVQHIFKPKLQLLAPDVEREIKNVAASDIEMLKNPKPQMSEELAEENIYQNNSDEVNKIPIDANESDDYSDAKLNLLEEQLSKVSIEFVSSVKNFNDVYCDLKPLILSSKANDFNDVGPSFQKVEPLLEDLLKLKESFHKLESSNSKFSKVNSELEDLLNKEILADESCAKTFKLLKDES